MLRNKYKDNKVDSFALRVKGAHAADTPSYSMLRTACPPLNTLQDTSIKEPLESLHFKIDNLQASLASLETKVNKIEGRLEGVEKRMESIETQTTKREIV